MANNGKRFLTTLRDLPRASLCLLMATVAVLLFLGWQVKLDLSSESVSLPIGLLDHADHQVARAHVTIKKEDGEDRITVAVTLRGRRGDSNTFGISLPDSFERIASESMSSPSEFLHHYDYEGSFDTRQWVYKVVGADSSGVANLREVFKGNALSGRGFDRQASISVHYLGVPIPTRLSLVNLDDSTVTYMEPRPDFQTDYALDYSENEVARFEHGLLRLQLQDRGAQLRQTFRAIIYGVAFGVCGSIIASFLVTWAQQRDSQRATKKE